MTRLKNYMVRNAKRVSGWSLMISFILFSFCVPFVQGELNRLKDNLKMYANDLMMAQIYQLNSQLYADLGRSLELFQLTKATGNQGYDQGVVELIKLINQRVTDSDKAFVSYQKSPFDARSPQEAMKMREEFRNKSTESVLGEINNYYLSRKNIFEWLERIIYFFAILLHVFGIYIGFFIKNETSEKVLVELRSLRGQVDRINKKK